MKVTINQMVDGGKASAGPPLGPALGPLGANVNAIIAEINKRTSDFSGLSVPVKVTVDKDTKEFEVEVGTPPVSALIKKEARIEKGAKAKGEVVADISLEKALAVARMKSDVMLARDAKLAAKEVLGTCVSMGVTCNGKDPRLVIAEIDAGKHDGLFKV